MNNIATIDIAQSMRIESALTYAHTVLNNPRIFSKIDLTERLRGLHNDDFEQLCKGVEHRSRFLCEQIIQTYQDAVNNIGFIVEKISKTAVSSSVQTNAVYSLMNLLKLQPNRKNAQVVVTVFFGCVSILYNYSKFNTNEKIKLIEARAKLHREQTRKICHQLTSCIYKEHSRYLQRCVQEFKTRAANLDTTANRIEFKFNAFITALQNSNSHESFREIVAPALEAAESESFEHVSEPSSARAEHALAEYGFAATPSNIAADYHMDFADAMLQQLEREFDAREQSERVQAGETQAEEVV